MAWTRIRFGGVAAVGLGVSLLAMGCGVQMETGYEYRPLNASTAERRAYYAPAFSPEKSAAAQEKKGKS